MGKHIGIDLGTTNTVAAVMEGQRARILQNPTGKGANPPSEYLLPSVVYVSAAGDRLVGWEALDTVNALEGDPEHAVISVKRLMGRQFGDENVQRSKYRYQYRIERSTDGTEVVIPIRKLVFSPTEISAEILKAVKKNAERVLGEAVTHAVITVPAYFDPVQKEQTRRAGEMAGLRVKRIIVEPTAAAIANNIGQDQGSTQTVLVFDLGGGTFDVSCLMSQGAMHEELATSGDKWLGGDDFDYAIMEACLKELLEEHGYDPKNERGFMFKLRKECEAAKRKLSKQKETEIVFPSLMIDGRTKDVCIAISRGRFQSLIGPLVDRTVKLTEEALSRANLTADRIDRVLLVGGSTAVPLVRDALIRLFGADKVSDTVDPMTCVAVGAAKLARDQLGITCPNKGCTQPGGFLNPPDALECKLCGYELRPETTCPNCGATNRIGVPACSECGGKSPDVQVGVVTASDYGIEVEGGMYEVIFPRGQAYPSRVPFTKQFETASEARRAILLRFYEGGSRDDLSKNKFLGVGEIQIVSGVPEGTPIDVSINVDDNGVLQCLAEVHFGDSKPVAFEIDPHSPAPLERRSKVTGEDWRKAIGYHKAYNLGDALLPVFASIIPEEKIHEMAEILRECDRAYGIEDRELARDLIRRAERWYAFCNDKNSPDYDECAPNFEELALPAFVRESLRVEQMRLDLESPQPVAREMDELIRRIVAVVREGRSGELQPLIDELKAVTERARDLLPPTSGEQEGASVRVRDWESRSKSSGAGR